MDSDLFDTQHPDNDRNDGNDGKGAPYRPLAATLRPALPEQLVGQAHILKDGSPLRAALEQRTLHSMLFWGPPGVGKTTLARMLCDRANAKLIALSAVTDGVKAIREAVTLAQGEKRLGRQAVLFVDEVHRFNKAQQDAFLPFVEDGTLLLLGATTENPAFELNSALLSRVRVYRLEPLLPLELEQIVSRGAAHVGLVLSQDQQSALAAVADGDARRALNLVELAASARGEDDRLPKAVFDSLLTGAPKRFDKGGDQFYDQISALHKAVRGSSPDAALYWYCRMLDGGCDPLYVARRVVRMASEDIGSADPRALSVALDAWQTIERLGSPEGELTLAQALIYLASVPKSNAVYTAFKAAQKAVAEGATYDVPDHLRNAPTALARAQGHGADYRYAHDEPGAFAAGENYLPEPMQGDRYYHPSDRGLEGRIKARLDELQELDRLAPTKRYQSD